MVSYEQCRDALLPFILNMVSSRKFTILNLKQCLMDDGFNTYS